MDEKGEMKEGMEHNHNGNNCMFCHGHHCEKCGMCSHCGGFCPHCGGRHMILRWIVGIIILVLVFWMGVKVGELRQVMYSGGSYGIRGGQYMMLRDSGQGTYFYGPGMMGLWGNQSTSTK